MSLLILLSPIIYIIKVNHGGHQLKYTVRTEGRILEPESSVKVIELNLALRKAQQSIPDTLSEKELTALLTPLLKRACYPLSSVPLYIT